MSASPGDPDDTSRLQAVDPSPGAGVDASPLEHDDPSRVDRADPSRGPADPNYILSQAEFHETLEAHARRQLAAEHVLLKKVDRQAIGLRQFIGWVLATFGCLALLLGLAILYSRDGMDVSHG
jgi:hypothetical protein